MSATRPPLSAIRAGLAVVSMLLLAWLGWQIVGNTFADVRAKSDPEAALAWRGDDADALGALAARRLAGGGADLASVVSAADRALQATPLLGSALVTLGLAADAAGDTDRADRLMQLADARSARNTGAELWLYDRRVREGRFDEAMGHVGALFRTRPDLWTDLTPSLIALAADETARPALVDLLTSDPPWRSWFLNRLSIDAPSPAVSFAVLSELKGSLRTSELAPYLNHTIGKGDFDLAFLAWLRFLPPQQAKNLPYVFNGDFEIPLSGLPFDWSLPDTPGASVDVIDSGDADIGHALRVVFAGRDARYRPVVKLLVLPPGRYELTGQARTEQMASARGLAWGIYCAEGEKSRLGRTGAVTETGGKWQAFTGAFEVPASGCGAAWLRLESLAEEPITGTILYDGITIRRVATHPG